MVEILIVFSSIITFVFVPVIWKSQGKSVLEGIITALFISLAFIGLIIFSYPDPIKILKEEVFITKYLWAIPLCLIYFILNIKYNKFL